MKGIWCSFPRLGMFLKGKREIVPFGHARKIWE